MNADAKLKTVADVEATYGFGANFGFAACYFRAEEGLFPLIREPATDDMLLSDIILGIRIGFGPYVLKNWFRSRLLSTNPTTNGRYAVYARERASGPVAIVYTGPDNYWFNGEYIYFYDEADAVDFELYIQSC